MRTSIRTLAALVGATLVAAAAVGVPSAFANEPATTTITVNTSFRNPSMSTACGFPVQQSAVGEIRVTTFSDGTVMQHRDLTITVSANGVTIAAKHQATFFTESGVRTSAGIVALFDLPDGRRLAADVGRLVVDLATREVRFEAGPHEVLNGPIPGQPTLLCPYLTGA
jgi:hypothetical protein